MGGAASQLDAGGRTLKRHDYFAFVIDVHRLRPLITLVLVLLTLVPSFIEMFTESLSPIVVLLRLALALALIGTLVWLISRVLLHYARIQAAGVREDSQSSPQF